MLVVNDLITASDSHILKVAINKSTMCKYINQLGLQEKHAGKVMWTKSQMHDIVLFKKTKQLIDKQIK